MRSCAALLALLLASLAQGCQGSAFWMKALDLSLESPDFGALRDGSYEGACDAGVRAEVRVVVQGRRVTAIELVRHETLLGKRAEAVLDRVLDGQTLDVDTVSGATLSSLAILKAVETALDQAL